MRLKTYYNFSGIFDLTEKNLNGLYSHPLKVSLIQSKTPVNQNLINNFYYNSLFISLKTCLVNSPLSNYASWQFSDLLLNFLFEKQFSTTKSSLAFFRPNQMLNPNLSKKLTSQNSHVQIFFLSNFLVKHLELSLF